MNGGIDLTGLLNTEGLEKKLDPVVEKLDVLINSLERLTGKKAKINIDSSGVKDIDALSSALSELENKIKAPKQKMSYFQTIENATIDLKKSWNDLVNAVNKGDISSDKLLDNSFSTKVLRYANAFEALGGNISNINPEITGLIEKMRSMEKYTEVKGYNFTVSGFKEAFFEFEKLRQLGVTFDGFNVVKNDVSQLLSLSTETASAMQNLGEQTRNAFGTDTGSMDNAIVEQREYQQELKNTQKEIALTEEQMRKRLQSSYTPKGNVDDWDVVYDSGINVDNLSDIEKYSQILDALTKKQQEALEYATLYQNRIAEAKNSGIEPKDYYATYMQDYTNDYHKYIEQIEYVQGRLQTALKSYTPNAEGNNAQAINALVLLLKNLNDQIEKISISFGTIDENSDVPSLLSSMQELKQNIADVAKEVEKLSSAFSNISFNVNISAGSGKNPIQQMSEYGDSARHTAKILKEAFNEIQSVTGMSVMQLTKFSHIGENNLDSNNIKSGLAELERIAELENIALTGKVDGKTNIKQQNLALKELIDLYQKAASYANIDLSGWTEKYSNNINKSIESTQKILSGEKQVEDATKQLTSLFGNANNISLEGITVEVDKIVNKLQEMIQLLQSIFTTKIDPNTENASTELINLVAVLNEIKQAIKDINSIRINPKINDKVSDTKDVVKSIATDSQDAVKTDSAVNAQNELQKELKETEIQAEKTAEALLKNRDIVSQTGLKQTYMVREPDENGNMIEREVGQFSFVERLQDGQLRNVLVTYNEQTRKWEEDTLSLSTAFEKVGNEVISLDNKINQLKNNRDKTLAAHPTYDASADNAIIKQTEERRQVLLDTLGLFNKEKEYVYEISKFEERRAKNAERLQNVTEKQNNLLQAKSDEEQIKLQQQRNIESREGISSFNKKDQAEQYKALSQATQEYIGWLKKEASATGSMKEKASLLRTESEALMNSLRSDIKSYGLQDLEKELELDRQILKARREINYQNEVDETNKAKASYERELKLEERKHAILINNIGASDKIIEKNKARIANIETLIKKEQNYRSEMDLEGKAQEALNKLEKERLRLQESLKTTQTSYNNYADKSSKSSESKKSYDEEISLLERINKLEIDNINASKTKQAENNEEIRQLNEELELLKLLREEGKLVTAEGEKRVNNKQIELRNGLRIAQRRDTAGQNYATTQWKEKALEFKKELHEALNTYTDASQEAKDRAQSLIDQLSRPQFGSFDGVIFAHIDKSNVDGVVKKIQNDTNKIINALKQQHAKVESETQYTGLMKSYEQDLYNVFQGSVFEDAAFKNATVDKSSGKATITFLELVDNKAREVVISINDVGVALEQIKNGTFDLEKYKSTSKWRNATKADIFGSNEASASSNNVQKIINAYNELIKSEDRYQKLRAKVDSDSATSEQIAEFKRLTGLRKEYNGILKESMVLSKEEQQFYEQSGKAKIDALNKRYQQQQVNSSYTYEAYLNANRVEADKNGIVSAEVYDEAVRVNEALKNTKVLYDNIFNKKQNISGFKNATDRAKEEIDELNKKLMSGDISNIQTGYTDKINKILYELNNIVGMVNPYAPDEDAKNKMLEYANTLNNGKVQIGDFTNNNEKLIVSFEKQKGVLQDIEISWNRVTGEISASEKGTRKAESTWTKFLSGLKQRFMSLGQYLMSFAGFYRIISEIRKGITIIRDLDTALTEMRKVSDETVQSLKNFQDVSFDIAKSVGTTAKEIQNSTADFMRLGYELEEASKLAKDANIYANVGDMEIDEATEHMISSIQAWKSEFGNEIEASAAIIDRYNEIGNNFAISSAEIGSAMERSSAALKAGGNTLNESLGLITAGNIIQQDAEMTAAALKILGLRIRGAKADLEEMGEETEGLAVSTSKMREELKALTGVDIMLDENTFKSTAQIIQEIGEIWEEMTDVSQAATLELLAGKNRASTVAGLLENYKVIGEVIESAENADGSAIEENERHLDSIEGKIAKLQNEVQEFWHNLIDSDALKGILDVLTDIVDKAGKLVDTIGTIPTILATVFGFIKLKDFFNGKNSGGRAKSLPS